MPGPSNAQGKPRFFDRTVHDDAELVAADAIDRVNPLKGIRQALRGSGDELVAGIMSNGVVCLL